jgi:hypothetical protein
VSAFVTAAAHNLEGSGTNLNRLIHAGAGVVATLSAKRDDLAQIITEFNKLTVALSTRQAALGQLIRDYGTVVGTLNANRSALEGTITGLNEAAAQLASLLLAHRTPLKQDVQTLTRSGQSLSRNAEALAQTGQWATLLFSAASRAADYSNDWLRLNNQGQELGALILMRLEERLMELCQQVRAGCANPQYWAKHVPSLFCFSPNCAKDPLPPGQQFLQALRADPAMGQYLTLQAERSGTNSSDLAAMLLTDTVGSPYRWGMGG